MEHPTWSSTKGIEFETLVVDEKGEIIARARHAAESRTEDLGGGVELEMLAIPGGLFQMGSHPHQGGPEERPRHPVSIKTFMMGRSLVTQQQWQAVMGRAATCRFKGDRLPVERVSWEEAQRFCRTLSMKSRKYYHLPSEAQWEYACRAGTCTPFYFGETITTQLANYVGEHIYRSEPPGPYRHCTTEAGTFPPNTFGLYDMHGNLWEWCEDSWLEDYTAAPRDGSAYTHRIQVLRAARGGSWHEPPANCRSAARIAFPKTDADEFMGFRVACGLT